LLADHETHVGIDTNAVAGDANSERHPVQSRFILPRTGPCEALPNRCDDLRQRQEIG
jgi:hypothetical protein